MKRSWLVLRLLLSPLSGCATERAYLFHDESLWDIVECMLNFIPHDDPYPEIDYSCDEPADICPL
jgi:hypothetical protein